MGSQGVIELSTMSNGSTPNSSPSMSSLDIVRSQGGTCRLRYSTSMEATSSSSVLTDGCDMAPLGVWVQGIQLSPYRAGLSRPVAPTLWPLLALQACCFPRCLSSPV